MITKVNNILPFQTNRDIIQMLINEARWKIASDVGRFNGEKLNSDIDKMLDDDVSNAGFSCVTFDRKYNHKVNTALNLYGDIIFYTIKNKLKTIETLYRIYWNYYDTSSKASLHKDELEEGYYSVIYNLHTNDGGTEIDNKFYPSVEGQALVFPSNVLHKGIASTKSKHRFNLNMIVK
jgi:hypothetical protein|tara:strand:- start:1465 stop:1998 length:534 start_codon:yes stop_codon:yes gene_type:complete